MLKLIDAKGINGIDSIGDKHKNDNESIDTRFSFVLNQIFGNQIIIIKKTKNKKSLTSETVCSIN